MTDSYRVVSPQAGEAFLGLREEGLVVAGSPGTQVARMSRETFLRQSEAAALLADWIDGSLVRGALQTLSGIDARDVRTMMKQAK